MEGFIVYVSIGAAGIEERNAIAAELIRGIGAGLRCPSRPAVVQNSDLVAVTAGHLYRAIARDTRLAIGSCRLDNRSDLLEQLPLGGSVCCDHTLFCAAHEKWGSLECVQHLHGEFNMVVWDSSSNSAAIYRDRLGLRSLYYSRAKRGFYCSSSARALVGLAGISVTLNLSWLNNHLQQGERPFWANSSPFKEISQLRPGHFITNTREAISEHRYWFPERTRHMIYKTPEEYVGSFLEVLETSIRSRLSYASSGPIIFDLSGGLDSTSIVFLARRLLGSAGATRMICRSYVDHDALRYSELQLILAARRQLDIPVRVGPYYRYDKGIDEILYGAYPTWDEPFRDYCFCPELERACEEVVREGGHVRFGGHFADRVLSAPSFQCLVHLLQHGEFARVYHDLLYWSRAAEESPIRFFVKRALRPALNHHPRSKRVPWVSNVERIDSLPVEQLAHFGCGADQEHFEYIMEGAVLANYHITHNLPFGVEYQLPYMDVRLIEFILRIPPGDRTQRPLPKWLLRDAMRDIIPEENRLKTTQPGGSFQILKKLRGCENSVRLLFDKPLLTTLGLIDTTALGKYLDQMFQGHAPQLSSFLDLMSTEIWLRVLRDNLKCF